MFFPLVPCALPGVLSDWLIHVQGGQVLLFVFAVHNDNLSARILWRSVN